MINPVVNAAVVPPCKLAFYKFSDIPLINQATEENLRKISDQLGLDVSVQELPDYTGMCCCFMRVKVPGFDAKAEQFLLKIYYACSSGY